MAKKELNSPKKLTRINHAGGAFVFGLKQDVESLTRNERKIYNQLKKANQQLQQEVSAISARLDQKVSKPIPTPKSVALRFGLGAAQLVGGVGGVITSFITGNPVPAFTGLASIGSGSITLKSAHNDWQELKANEPPKTQDSAKPPKVKKPTKASLEMA